MRSDDLYKGMSLSPDAGTQLRSQLTLQVVDTERIYVSPKWRPDGGYKDRTKPGRLRLIGSGMW